MIKRFLPDVYSENIYKVNYKKLKKRGVKCLLFDLDNTITPAREEVFYEETKKLFRKLEKDFRVILFSNNFRKRVSKFGDFYTLDIECLSLKPNKFKYKRILKKYNYKSNEVAAIGDQLLTDINGANKVKMVSVLVNPISEIDEKETWFNRKIEKIIFNYYKKHDAFIKDRYYD